MNGQWYYSHGGITHGPFSNEEIRERAARKMLLENDWLWQGSREPKDAFPAQAALDFSNLPLVVSPIPDWLADVAEVESQDLLASPVASKEAPDWLEDLRLWVGLDFYAAEKKSPNSAGSAIKTDGIPDWLDGWIAPPKTQGFHNRRGWPGIHSSGRAWPNSFLQANCSISSGCPGRQSHSRNRI